MAPKFRELYNGIPQGRRTAIETRVQEALRELPLHEIRRARSLTQAQLAEDMDATQGEISALEKRTDHYVSTLRRYIHAMGGELDIIARFPNGDAIKIQRFSDMATDEGPNEASALVRASGPRKRDTPGAE